MAEKATAAPPLTVENVCEAVQGVEWTILCGALIAGYMYDEIKQIQDTSNENRLRAVVECWLGGALGQKPSWRRLIWTLDVEDQSRVADNIRHFAEPVLDSTLTMENVTAVMKELEHWERVARGRYPFTFGLRIPRSKLREIKQQASSERDKSYALGGYWINTDPNASWKKLAHVLYEEEEQRAGLMVKQYLPKADPTLTTDNLMEVVKGVEDRWDELGFRLYVVSFKRVDITMAYQSDHRRMEATLDYYVRSPTPSWKEFAGALQTMELHKQADEVTTKHVKVSERSKELFDEAMKDGYVEARDIKALIFGAAGTGKSHTIALIMDEEPPSVRRSTPCATRPVRAMSRIRAKKRGEKWVKVTREELSQTIADTATVLPSKPSTSRNSKSSESAASTIFTGSETSKQHATNGHPTAHSSSSKEIQHACSISEKIDSVCSPAEDELLRRIEMSPSAHWAKKTFKRDRIFLIDTGGQPQFHEVLPIFMQGTSASMFTIKLSERLSDRPLIEYYDENGSLVGTPYRSAYTNQQVLSHCMKVIHAQVSQSEEGLCPNTIFIGTHKDLEKQCPESREDKNLKIREMLLPVVEKDTIYCGEGLKELIFPVNVKTPGPQEKRFTADLRRVITDRSNVKPKQIPLRWNALELTLQELMLELGRGVLTKAECFAAAQRFHFDKESFEEALKYFHHLNVLFYYKDVLPDVVFCDPMVLLTKLTELAEHSYKLRTDPSQHRATEGKLRKFRSEGIITLELLSKKQFASHYIPGVFGPEELLKLFKKLLIVSQISEEEYLMPCLLPVADDPGLLSPSGSVPSLLLYYPHGALVGVFCALAAYLLSEAKWKLLLDTDLSPVKVDRNTIEFQVPRQLPGKVILTDSFSTYFQVTLHLPKKVPVALYSEVCPLIRETILAGLRKASTTLHYSNSEPCDAFLCCEHSDTTTSPHATVVDSSYQLMTCTINPSEVCTTLTKQHMVWFGSSGASDATTSGAATQSSSTLCSPSESQVITDLKPRMAQLMRMKTSEGEKVDIIKAVAPDWKQVGFLMDFDPNGQNIRCIEAEHAHKMNGPVVCCQEIFTLWLDSPDATWGNLIELLIDSEYTQLAEQVKSALGP